MSGIWLWYLSRAAGVATILLFTAVVVLGALLAGPRRPRSALITAGLHRSLALGSLIFLALHVSTAIADNYVDIGLAALVLPFASGYDPLGVALGTLAFDIAAAVIATSLLRHRLPERWWRFVHRGAYAMAPLAVLHGSIMSAGSALAGVPLLCGVAMAGAVAWRWTAVDRDAERRKQALAQEWT